MKKTNPVKTVKAKMPKAEVKTEATVSDPHRDAVMVAQQIETVMGKDYFTIDQMRKKMMVTPGGSKHPKKLSWTQAEAYIKSILSYGLVEAVPAVKGCYKIRLDQEYRLAYADQQIKLHQAKIEALEQLRLEIAPQVPKPTLKVAKKGGKAK